LIDSSQTCEVGAGYFPDVFSFTLLSTASDTYLDVAFHIKDGDQQTNFSLFNRRGTMPLTTQAPSHIQQPLNCRASWMRM
jgi:hypothetical protein